MRFIIEIKDGWTRRYYNVQRISDNGSFEQFRIWNDSLSIILQSNRPLLRGKGLKHKSPIWKQIEGSDILKSVFESFIKAIMKRIE